MEADGRDKELPRVYIMPLGHEIELVDGTKLIRISASQYKFITGRDRGTGTPFYDPQSGEAHIISSDTMEIRDSDDNRYIPLSLDRLS